MRFNNIVLRIAVVAASLLVLSGCDADDHLDVPPQGAVGEDVLEDENGVETLLTGAYGALDGNYFGPGNPWEKGGDNWIYGSVAGADAHKGTDAGDQPPVSEIAIFDHGPSQGFFNNLWIARFEGVTRANSVLELIPEVEEWSSDDAPTVAEAEARFLRGHFYFELKKHFDKVPWVDEETEDPNQPNDEDIWPRIEEDFEFAMENLPEERSTAGAANSWAAASYLAKTYVFQEKWSDALPLFDEIINQGNTAEGVPYGLLDEYNDNWNPNAESGSPERVFSIEQVADDGAGNATGNAGHVLNYPYGGPFPCCGFFQPTQMLVNSYKTVDGLPIVDDENHSYNDDEVEHDQGISSGDEFEPSDKELDPRLDWTAGRRGVPYHDWGPHPGRDWIRDQGYAGPYSPKKNVWWSRDEDEHVYDPGGARASSINIPVIRFADVLLLAAEAEIEEGSLEQARQYVNRVRERAANEEGWVSNEMNEANALVVVDSEDEVYETDASSGDWVVNQGDNSTYVLLEGEPDNPDNWQQYEEPNYVINTYDTPWVDADEARAAVHFERKLELAMEGHRFYDLSRWGKAESELNAYFEYEGSEFNNGNGLPDVRNGEFQSDKNEYFPIPQAQIDLSAEEGESQLEQNPGY